jgi:hypothetical protein
MYVSERARVLSQAEPAVLVPPPGVGDPPLRAAGALRLCHPHKDVPSTSL